MLELVKYSGACGREAKKHIQIQLLPSEAFMDEFLNLSKLQFPHVRSGDNKANPML